MSRILPYARIISLIYDAAISLQIMLVVADLVFHELDIELVTRQTFQFRHRLLPFLPYSNGGLEVFGIHNGGKAAANLRVIVHHEARERLHGGVGGLVFG
ncbi:MAG: hypothetical protein WBX25_28760 [Rhodomicrobium sp.]